MGEESEGLQGRLLFLVSEGRMSCSQAFWFLTAVHRQLCVNQTMSLGISLQLTAQIYPLPLTEWGPLPCNSAAPECSHFSPTHTTLTRAAPNPWQTPFVPLESRCPPLILGRKACH